METNEESLEIIKSKKATQELIGGALLWGFIFGLLFGAISSFIGGLIESLIISAVIAVILNAVYVFFVWKFSAKSTFKTRRLERDDLSKVIKNLVIFTIIICILSSIYSVVEMNNKINKVVETSLYTQNRLVGILGTDSMKENYEKQKQELISSTRNEVMKYVVIVIVGSTIVRLLVLIPIKKEIEEKYTA